MTDTASEVKAAIENALPGAIALVRGAGGHFEIVVTSEQFAGKGTVEKQRLVYRAIKHLMAGDDAPVHAVDRLDCKTP
jgi:acid stress-induced BolA-like protein IbaG/YrbA